MGVSAAESNGTSHDTEALYREHGAAVARFCRSLLRDRSEAEDATQQVFLSAHRALLNGSTPREPLAWLIAVARHECYARFGQRTASPAPAGDVPDGTTPDASAHVLRAGELAAMWDEVGKLPSTQREAFLLREIRGLSYGQLAAELSLSAPSVRSLLARARTRVRHRLRDVAAGLGGAPWAQALVRLVAGGDGTSPLPAATKAAAVGVGALALVGGGDLARLPHHSPRSPGHPAARHHARARVRHAATSPVAAAPSEDRRGSGVRRSEPERSRSGGDGSRESGSSRGSSSGGRSSESGEDHGGAVTAVAQLTTDGSGGDGGGGTSTTSGRDGSPDSSSDGGSSGSTSGSDGGSGSTTTTTSSGSDGSGSSGGDGGGSGDGGTEGG